MKDSICRILPMIVSMVISQYIYIKIDKKYNVTNKIYLKLPIQNKWVPFFICISMFIILIILALLTNMLNIPYVICYVLGGLIIGIVSGININYINKIK